LTGAFNACKNIPAFDVARREGLELHRKGDRFWTCCPLHGEKTPSLCFFPDGGWKCFGCGEGGDSVAFLAALHGIKPLDAAKQIDVMYSLQLFDGQQDLAEVRRREQQAGADREAVAMFNEWWRIAGHTVAEYLWMLDTWKRDLAPATPDEPWDERYCEALQNIDYWDHLFDEYILGGGTHMEWHKADGEAEERWHRNEQHAFALRIVFYKTFGKEVDTLGERLDAIRKGRAA